MTTDDRFQQLISKFQPAIDFLEQQGASLQTMNVQDNKLLVRAIVESEAVRDQIVEQFRKADPQLDEVHADIRIGEENVPVTGQSTVQTSQHFSHEGEPAPGSDTIAGR